MSYGDYNNHVRGKLAELSFKITAESKGWVWRDSTPAQDMHDHIDCFITKSGVIRTIDVKSIKLVNGVPHVDSTYIEFVNASGEPGWLFGKVDWYAFEYEEKEGTFLIIHQRRLIEIVFNHAPAMGNIFSRPTLMDQVTKIPTSLILDKCEIWRRND